MSAGDITGTTDLSWGRGSRELSVEADYVTVTESVVNGRKTSKGDLQNCKKLGNMHARSAVGR